MKAKTKKFLVIASLVSLSACGHDLGGYSEIKASGSNTESSTEEPIQFTNLLSSPGEMERGDILYIDFDADGRALVDFEGAPEEAEFSLIVGTASTVSGSYSMFLSDNLADLEGKEVQQFHPEDDTLGADIANIQEEWDATLRVREADISLQEPASLSLNAAKAATTGSASVTLGDSETFRVLSSLSSTNAYVEVTATAECVGSNVVFYVDDQVAESELPHDDVLNLCEKFDAIVAEEIALFGDVSDINGDGYFDVLMTPQVNRLGGMGGGIITGFFNASDLYPRSSGNPVSNGREILHVMVPDPTGRYGVQISRNFALSNLLPAVLPHELQHAISYNQHVFMNKGQPEASWLNEGLSHLAEDLMGQNQENPSRYAIYLSNPASYPLVSAASPGLGTRGAAYLFLRYLYEQSEKGPAFIGRMLNTHLTGVTNIETAFDGRDPAFDQFGEFFWRWNVALVLTNRGITKDSRYVYRDRIQNSETGSWSGVCITCAADDNRGTILSGMSELSYFGYHAPALLNTTAKVFDVTNAPSEMALDSNGVASAFGVLVRVR